ncbi:outer dense fiber protein 3-like [Limulus polyphemus]|uniref:Outer dense fiber protein 3-like n=1 Tax=Limulus polyphemus TaxID=6850 RepID=A0ABM1BS66_LIMPO|nr:outer dense fiber protein 3-like [Limulus polyphemus]
MVIKSNSPTGYVLQRPWTPTKRRGPIAAEHIGPGPAYISLPSTFGLGSGDTSYSKSPSYTFGSKVEARRKNFTPGPGSYDIAGISEKGKETVPAPSISGRMKDPDKFITPAPGAYTPEQSVKTFQNGSPSYSFGVKLKDQKKDNYPAPNTYNVNGEDVSYPHSPSYSMGAKLNHERINNTPGPGAFSPEKVRVASQQAPAYSFGIRHSPYASKTPS